MADFAPEIIAKIDQIALYTNIRGACDYPTNKYMELIFEVYAAVGPGAKHVMVQNLILERISAFSQYIHTDLATTIEFCKSVAHLVQ